MAEHVNATQIALCGIGKIAQDQHVPALRANPDWHLAATLSRHGSVPGVPHFSDVERLLSAHPDITVYSLCLPPSPRFALARRLIAAGKDVMLEKPPGATLAEVYHLVELARQHGVTLYTTWHSRMAAGVATAQSWLADKTISRAHITWREDVRRWHPGQEWVFEPGGMGVFDPGINALSIMTRILPAPVHLLSARLETPQNRAMPIAAQLAFSGNVTADFDWRQEGPQIWQITVDTPQERLELRDGGATVFVNDTPLQPAPTGCPDGEYPALYAEMNRLIRARQSDVDLSPMIHVADAFTLGRHVQTPPFDF